MDIRCRKGLCKYNDRFTCKAKRIIIDKRVVCETFDKDENKNKPVQDVTKDFFECTPHYAPQRDSKALEIKCRTDCLFNHNGTCVSNGITLNSIKEKPYCVSYIKK
jgi:hypothetical protein